MMATVVGWVLGIVLAVFLLATFAGFLIEAFEREQIRHPIPLTQVRDVSITTKTDGGMQAAAHIMYNAACIPDGSYVAFGFDWGDGAHTSNWADPIATHTYIKPGTYRVTGTVGFHPPKEHPRG